MVFTRSTAPTAQVEVSNVVVVSGGDEKLCVWCNDAAAAASGALVEQCSLSELVDLATRLCPYAIVVPEEVFEFDSGELHALARDLRAELVVSTDAMDRNALYKRLVEAARRLG